MPKTAQFVSASLIAIACSAPAFGQSAVVTTPNITTAAGEESKTLNGQTFVNKGLIGAGRLSAGTRDFNGETLGSFSGMAINLATWRRNGGTYSGSFYTLPDRGPNDVGTIVGTSNYAARLHISDVTLTPGSGATSLPQSAASQNQVTVTPAGGFLLTDATGAPFTGRDPGTGTLTRNGITYPSPITGLGAGRISLDAEGLAFRRDGSFYISDEYAAGIYYFDRSGRQIGAIAAPPALLPRNAAGQIDFNSVAPGVSGRRNNQGLEALAITPTGKRLVTILQSATVQDTNGANQQTRNNTRILVYDISSSPTPTNPIGHYVLQLPTFTQAGNGAAVNRTAAQSEMLALNDNQFLVLARDGIGRGSGASATNSPVYKSVLLVDTTGATNLAGTAFETGTTAVATNGVLNSTIRAVQQIELINMLNPVQLGRFGMNLSTAPSSATSLSEKQEAMALVPVLDEAAPQDFFLFVGNDNDFQAANGLVAGTAYDASLTGSGGTGNNDSVFLVYRLTLPTYVDPEALAFMNSASGLSLVATRTVAADIGSVATDASMGWLSSVRSASDSGYGSGLNMWSSFDWKRTTANFNGVPAFTADGLSATGGVDYGFSFGRIGVSVGHRDVEGGYGFGSNVAARGTSVGGYAAFAPVKGLHLEIAGSHSVDLDFSAVTRPAAYGLFATSKPGGKAWSASGELGYLASFGSLAIGPIVRADFVKVDLDGATESGAALGNAVLPALAYERLRGSFGAEANWRQPGITLSLRGGYAIERERGDTSATVRLASAQHINGTSLVALPGTERDGGFVGGRIDGRTGRFFARAGGEYRFGRGEDDARFTVGIGFNF